MRMTFCVMVFFLIPLSAQAYVGPGAAIGMLGALITVLVAIGTSIGVLVLWPLRKMKKRSLDSKSDGPVNESAAEELSKTE